jgi:hypothetical protein
LLAQEKRGKTVPDGDTKKKLLLQAHEAGHFGEKAMCKNIDNAGYWWPGIRGDVANTIKDCIPCQKHTIVKSGYSPAQSIYAARPSDHYQIDLLQLPQSMEGWKFCLICVDVFTGFVMLKPLVDKSASCVARALWDICCTIGLPRILQSDNGTEFSNKICNSLCRLTGIPRRFIAPYNPRADGKVERSVKTVKSIMAKLLHGTSALWPLYIPFVQLAYNNKVHELTGATPFSLMFGRAVNEVRDYTDEEIKPYKPVDLNEWRAHQDKVVSLIYPSVNYRVKSKQSEYCKKLDKIRKKVVKDELVPGTLVMIKDPLYLINPGTRPYSEPPYLASPYTIVRRSLYGPYIIRDGTGQVYPRQVPIDQMKILYSPNEIPKDYGDDHDSEGNNEWEIDYILNHSENDGEFKYHIVWKGYGVKDATWDRESNINDPQPIERYFKRLAAKRQLTKKHGSMVNMLNVSDENTVLYLNQVARSYRSMV